MPRRSNYFIITSGVSAKDCARHYGPGKHPSQFARTLLFEVASEAEYKEILAAFFLVSVKFRVKEQTQKRTKGIGNHSTSSLPYF